MEAIHHYSERGNHMSEIILETKPVGDITGKFFIPSYQRGYRWGKNEVERLLDDVYSIGEASGRTKNYCLQPIVVRRKAEDEFELIDGQQRLTTLFLIYKYMHAAAGAFIKDAKFTLSYDTREKSAEFLENINPELKADNIDFWFMSGAYETIDKWFQNKNDIATAMMHINAYFAENVKVIWYEVGEDEDAIELFARLNIGKIPLTSAELVKAMFLSRDNNEEMDRRKQEEISLQWDNIEKELNDDRLWYFLINPSMRKYRTKIDLVLDLMAEKAPREPDVYYTFFKFDQMRQEKSLTDIWRDIRDTFLIMKDWFGNHTLYHKIGYLITSGYEKGSLSNIYKLSQGKTKTQFRQELETLIKDSIKIKDNYGELSYEKPADCNKITGLLLLFNVESVLKNGESTQWFPFDKYKSTENGRVFWSLEHIHARQSEGMRKQEEWREWLQLHIKSVKSVLDIEEDETKQLINDMQTAIDRESLDRTEFEQLMGRVTEKLSVPGGTEYMHNISNLALLNSGDNAALNNSTFDVKRNRIIELDQKGQYIPFCTRMVFFKYYTPSEANQLHFWGHADRVAYIDAINKKLADYLTEPITIEPEEQES